MTIGSKIVSFQSKFMTNVILKKEVIIMFTSFTRFLVILFITTASINLAKAETINVAPGTDTIQTAIDSASNGDILQLIPGTYKGDINYSGKAITIQGTGIDSIIQGSGNLATIIFNNNEGAASILDQVQLKGGKRAGAILVNSASPIIRRTWFLKNKAIGAGSAIYLYGRDSNGDSASITNCVFTLNRTKSAKLGNIAHTIHINDSDPSIINNTIIYNDRAGIHMIGNSNPIIKNNILGYNGRVKSKGKKRGRGIFIESAEVSIGGDIQYNLLYNNKRADFGFGSSGRVKPYSDADAITLLDGYGDFTLENNLTGEPLFSFTVGKKDKKKLKKTFDISLDAGSPAIDAGDPDSSFNDTDTSANDIGATGGPTPIIIE